MGLTGEGKKRRTILVAGIGNVLMGDDAVGPTIIERLRAGVEFPPEVELLEAGTMPPHELAYVLAAADVVILIDGVGGAGPPGTIHTYDRAAILAHDMPRRTTPHDPGLHEALAQAELLSSKHLEVTLVGVVAESVEMRTEMSAPVLGALPEIEDRVLHLLREAGAEPRPRAVPEAPDLWWRRE